MSLILLAATISGFFQIRDKDVSFLCVDFSRLDILLSAAILGSFTQEIKIFNFYTMFGLRSIF